MSENRLSSRYGKTFASRRIHGHEGTGQGAPTGGHSVGAFADVPDRGSGSEVVRAVTVGRRAGLWTLRFFGHACGQERQAHAVSVPGLQAVLRGEDRNTHGQFSPSSPHVGLRNLLGLHEPKGRVIDETSSGLGRFSKVRVVHAATHPGSLPGRRADGLSRSRGSGRDLHRRAGTQQAREGQA